jgi:hypothetical protein
VGRVVVKKAEVSLGRVVTSVSVVLLRVVFSEEMVGMSVVTEAVD